MDVAPHVIKSRPGLHWGLVLVLGAITGGVFTAFWLVVQARWIRHVTGRGIGLVFAIGNLVAVAGQLVYLSLPARMHMSAAWTEYGTEVVFAVFLAAVYTVRYELMHEPIGMFLGKFLPFFLGPVYFQYRLMDYGADGDFDPSGRMLKF